MMGAFRGWLQHHFNEQHVRCRLRELADRLAALWGRLTRPVLYGRR